MIKTARRSDVDQMAQQMQDTMDRMVRQHFASFRAEHTWMPAINAYRLGDRIEVAVDLAGVDRESIDVHVKPGQLTVRGYRDTPDPTAEAGEPIQVLAMEIEDGPFERVFAIPRQVAVRRVTARQDEGLLWITLPLRKR